MNRFMQFIVVAALGIGVLGLTSGCGKKMFHASLLESDQQTKLAVADVLPIEQQTQLLDETPSTFSTDSSGQAMLASHDSTPAIPLSHDVHEKQDTASRQSAQRNDVPFTGNLLNIYFDFDSSRLSQQSQQILEANATWFKANPHKQIMIEGHCDERGTQAYNYTLGEKRAIMARQYLSFLGVPPQQVIIKSFGKDNPTCRDFSEPCFQKNRRAHFVSDVTVAMQ